MPITTTRVSGPVVLPDGVVPASGRVVFALRSWDRESGSLVVGAEVAAVLDAQGEVSVDLWVNGEGARGTVYGVSVEYWAEVSRKQNKVDLGTIVVPDVGPVVFADLLSLPAPDVTVPDALAQALAASAAADASASAAEAFRDEVLATPSKLARAFVDVSEYLDADQTLDVRSGLLAAFAANVDAKEYVLPPREYLFLNRGAGTFQWPTKARIIVEADTPLDFRGWGNNPQENGDQASEAVGTFLPADAIAVDLVRGDRVVPLPSGAAAKYARGKLCKISSTEKFTDEDDLIGLKGEWVQIADIVGDDLRLVDGIQDDYTAAGHTLVIECEDDLVDLIFDNLQMIGAGQFDGNFLGDRGLQVINARRLQLNDADVAGFDFMNFHAVSVFAGGDTNCRLAQFEQGKNTENSYNHALSNCINHWRSRGLVSKGGKEGAVLTPYGGSHGVTRNVVYDSPHISGARRSAYATHDTHEGIHYISPVARDCEQGFDLRIEGVRVTDPVIDGMGSFDGTLDCAFQFGSGAGEIEISGSKISDVLRGFWMPQSIDHEKPCGDIRITDPVIRGDRCAYGVLLDFRGSARTPASADLGKLTVTGFDFQMQGTGAPVAIEAQGRWRDTVIQGEVSGGASASAAVYLHGTDLGGAGFGPVNPFVDVRYPATFNSPLVAHVTGEATVVRRGIGFLAEGQTRVVKKASVNFGNAAAGSFAGPEVVAVAGAIVGDKALAWMDVPSGPIFFAADVVAGGNVEVRAVNFSGTDFDLATGNLFVEVCRT